MTRPDEIAARAGEPMSAIEMALTDLRALIDEYDPKESDWNFRKTCIHTVMNDLSARLSATSPGDAMREALELLAMQQRARARAFRLLDGTRAVSDAETLAKADAYEECGNELLAALTPTEKAGDDPLDDLVARFSSALLEKLKAARVKYGYDEGWRDGDWEADCQRNLITHLAKGDPRDVAAYCAFMWHHGWKTVAALAPAEKAADGLREHQLHELGKQQGRDMLLQSLDCFTGGTGDMSDGAEAVQRRIEKRFDDLSFPATPTPPRAEVRTAAIEECMKAIDDLRSSGACNFTDPRYAGQRGQDRADALYDGYQELRKLIQSHDGGTEGGEA